MPARSEILRAPGGDSSSSTYEESLPAKIDLQSVVRDVINGDEEAATQLDGELRPKLAHVFSEYMPEVAEDLTQETLLKVAEKLPDFNPELGKGETYAANFLAWLYRIGRNKLVDHQRKESRELSEVPFNDQANIPSTEDSEDEAFDISNQTIINLLKNNFPFLLTDNQMRIVKLKAEGRSISEITEILGSTENSVKVRMTKARGKIESTILIPAGYYRLSKLAADRLGYSRLLGVIKYGTLKHIKILGRYYTTEEAIGNYRMRRNLNQQLIDQGYVPLIDHTTAREYSIFINSDLILRNNGRALIKKEDLERLKETPRIIPDFKPTLTHERLIGLCQSESEHNLALNAIKNGKLQSLRCRGVRFVVQEDFDSWRREREERKS